MKPLHIHYFMPQGIGDVIMTIPVIKKIAEEKSVRFSISVKSETEATIIRELCPGLNFLFIYLQDIYHKYNTLVSFLSLVKRIRHLSPDIVLTQYNVSAEKSSLISFLAGVKIRVGWYGPFSFLNTLTLCSSGEHKIAENFKSLQALDIDAKNVLIEHPLFQPNKSNLVVDRIDTILNSNQFKIAISPGSQEFDSHKRWPKSNFSQLINKILAEHQDIFIYLIGDKSEKKLCEEILQEVNHREIVLNLAGGTSIPELLYFLSKVDLTISNCNGISHMACTANCPIIGLYGPTNYKVTGPISNTFIPISAGLDCSPCYSRDYRFGCGNPICMEKIEVDEVYQSVKKIIVNY